MEKEGEVLAEEDGEIYGNEENREHQQPTEDNEQEEANGVEDEQNEVVIPPPPPPPIPVEAMNQVASSKSPLGVDLSADLKTFENAYLDECKKERPAPEAKFNYAWALLRSGNRNNIKRGITLLKGLSEDRFCPEDCLYYMAIGYHRLDNLRESRRCLEALLQASPNCRPAISLLDIVEDRIMKEGLLGLSVAGLIVATTTAMATVVLTKRG